MSDAQWQDLDGKPYTLQSKGRRYQEIAEAIQRSMSTLDAIVDEVDNKSLAMTATRDLARDVKADIEKAKTRYAETGEALETYGKDLEVAAYEQANPAATQLRTLHGDLADAEAAERRTQSAADDLPADATDAEKTEASSAASTAGTTAGNLRTEVAKYEAQWTEGHEAKERAAGVAKGKIHNAVYEGKAGDLNDSGWDKFKDWASKALEVIKVICDIAGILAIFLSWVPVLGQILLVLAAIGSIIAIVEGIVKMAKEGFSWGALFGVAMGVLGLFGGKAISALAKYAKAKSVVNAAGRMSNRASRVRFGRALIRDSHAVMRETRSARAFDLLKSPFARSAENATRMRAFQSSRTFTNFMAQTKSAAKAAFPNPFTDFGKRALFGNSDIIESFAKKGTGVMANESKYIFEGGTKVAINVARGGAATLQGLNFANNGMKAWNDFSGGNAIAGMGDLNTGVASVVDAPWSKISGTGIKYLDKVL